MVDKWREVKLGEIAEIYDGPHATPKKTESGPIFLGISNLSRGLLDLSNTEHISENDFHRWTRRVEPEEGDVVFSYETRLGEAARISHGLRCCLGRRMGLLRARVDLVDPRFLLYAYLDPDFQDTLYSLTVHGSTVDRIPLINMPHFPIVIPGNIQEQRRIAHILGTLDDKIENNRKTAKTLEAMAQAIFKSWFVDFDPVRAKMAGESRESICKRLKLTPEILDLFPDRLVDSELGEIPEGWGVKSLDSIGNFLNGLAMQKFPSSGQDDALPVIKIAQLRAGDLTCADQASREIESQFVIHDGDILFSWSGSLECVLWSGGIGALNQHLFKVTPKSNYPRWLCYFGIHHFLEFFREIAAGKATTMGHIQRHHLSDTKLALPCASNLDTMNKPIQFIFEAMWMRAVEARKLSSLRDTLLPKLISGEIRVPEAEDLVQEATR
ncbi:restriction endonuclease subunit S [Acidithiobacillus ferriphilus]|uniref:restriction endonuclease subunit S n=1 Tax=Acidithiobacillus ferriphilus TaxID=1689834 RepID=UPI002DBB836A|nr:restriction endonuclease subunit S [Acidithiobacillus ferriphilus]MEB8475322.1 restriction endonuclease subunit S [Acidithiobacillus ferriphilus]